MGWTAPPQAPKCPACQTSVFPAESFMASDRTPFHKRCVKCKNCNKSLTSATLNEHKTQLYCLPCYDVVFNQQSAGGSQYQGFLTAEEKKAREEEKLRKLEKSKRSK